MREDLMRPILPVRPMVGDVEALESAPDGAGQDKDRDILMALRQRLKDMQGGYDTWPAPRKHAPSEEDKYEPQRLNRKICWQYDSSAKKVPLLRRHYI